MNYAVYSWTMQDIVCNGKGKGEYI